MITSGELPAHKVWESDEFEALMDKYPLIPGQIVVISKEHNASNFADMSDELTDKFMKHAKRIAKAMAKALAIDRCTFMIEGLDVDHAHVKVFPVYDRTGYATAMAKEREELSDSQLKELAEKIRREVDF